MPEDGPNITMQRVATFYWSLIVGSTFPKMY